jgi:D-alanyl-D-alanine carboxypeptidase/D-alanyl-D-alanine-endopeptidase (penicillin-binding protein 4)
VGGTTSAASKVVTAHWQGKKIDLTGFQMTDGCGLSRTNSITARQMTLMLYHLANSPHFETFYQSLPIAGRPGTLRKIAQGANREGLVHAKSGSIERVKLPRNHLGRALRLHPADQQLHGGGFFGEGENRAHLE